MKRKNKPIIRIQEHEALRKVKRLINKAYVECNIEKDYTHESTMKYLRGTQVEDLRKIEVIINDAYIKLKELIENNYSKEKFRYVNTFGLDEQENIVKFLRKISQVENYIWQNYNKFEQSFDFEHKFRYTDAGSRISEIRDFIDNELKGYVINESKLFWIMADGKKEKLYNYQLQAKYFSEHDGNGAVSVVINVR